MTLSISRFFAGVLLAASQDTAWTDLGGLQHLIDVWESSRNLLAEQGLEIHGTIRK